MKRIILATLCACALSSCHIYRNYQRPEDLPIDGLYREPQVGETFSGITDTSMIMVDTVSLGDISWREMFQDTLLQALIQMGLEQNTDYQTALLRVDQAQSQLKAARLSFLPSFSLSPQGSINSSDGGVSGTKSYEFPVQASWEIDLFGKLRNAKQAAKAYLLEQESYQQAVRSELIATIANDYFTLMMIDGQIALSEATLQVWNDQVRTMELRLKVGEETENAVTQARASLYELEASHNDLIRQQREAENSLCTLLGITYQPIRRGKLSDQTFPDFIQTGIPLRLLSCRPDVVQAEMALAGAYYSTNQARSAFYPSLTLSGSAGWANSFGEIVSDPGNWILSALVSLVQPLFKRGELISNLRVSEDEEKIELLNYKQVLLEAGQEVNDALYAVGSNRFSLEKHTRQCEELKRSVQIAEALYRTGNATYLELLTARQSLLSAQLSVVQDDFTRCQSMIHLYHALGGGRN